MDSTRVLSSFRDPSGFLFLKDSVYYRQINPGYQQDYDLLMNSGLYNKLVNAELLIPHEEVDIKHARSNKAYKVIKPECVPFISYPYEWCFSQLKDAALATLKIQKTALEFGMALKDCSAYNIQFRKCKPILIDTLSFEKYCPGSPWVAYRQFCQHFLAPLALMSYADFRLNKLLQVYIDGIPLDLTSQLLPLRGRFKFSLFSHIHLHAQCKEYFGKRTVHAKNYKMNRLGMLGLIDNLEAAIKNLRLNNKTTEWAHYYDEGTYSQKAFQHKEQIVSGFLDRIKPNMVWDLGANIGLFSRIASDKGIQVISFDSDHVVVERNYNECVKKGETNILPLLVDLTNPSPCIGWENQERMSFFERGPVDAALALALIHHLLISNNTPMDKVVDFFAKICNALIVEFVPKDDPQAQRLLLNREDIFPNYTRQAFEKECSTRFDIKETVKIKESQRTLYLLSKK